MIFSSRSLLCRVALHPTRIATIHSKLLHLEEQIQANNNKPKPGVCSSVRSEDWFEL
jgi:hypothetical protein